MRRRFWIAVLAGGLTVGAAAAGFGPCVERELEKRAEAYGARLEVQRIWPSWDGLRLRGVDVTLADLPEVQIRLDDVRVSWSSPRQVRLAGGRVVAVGPLDRLWQRAEKWRRRHVRAGPSGGSSAGDLRVEGLELEWRERERDPQSRFFVRGLRVAREDGKLRFDADALTAKLAGAELAARRGRLVLASEDGTYRARELFSQTLELRYRIELEQPLSADGGGDQEDGPPRARAETSARPHRRVRAARKVRQRLVAAAAELDRVLGSEARVAVDRAHAAVEVGDERLNLGPGTLRVERGGEAMTIALSPSASSPPEPEPRLASRRSEPSLGFALRIPLGPAAEPNGDALVAELDGGPVWLSTLGLREGDLGLRGVAGTSLEAKARLVLAADGGSLRLDGRGTLRDLGIHHPKLADQPLEHVELGWTAELGLGLDGKRIDVDHAEVRLGELRLGLRGGYQRGDDGHQLDAELELKPVGCQQAFAALPKALVPRLVGMRFDGTLAAKGQVRLDTARLGERYHVDWDGTLECRVIEVPPALDSDRLRGPFRKIAYTPDGRETELELGPGTDGWTPYGAISRHLDAAVIVTEDGRFYRHRGFDQEAIVNSMRENLQAGRFVRGASTISMQLARNLFLRRDKTVSRKLQEAILTLYLEQEFSKQELMELYLNVIEFGPMVYGIGPAAQHYFRRSPAGLSVGQSFYLASILPKPQTQHFGAGGAVSPRWASLLRAYMRVGHRIHRLTDEELEIGLRETVVYGSPTPLLEPPEGDLYADADALDPLH